MKPLCKPAGAAQLWPVGKAVVVAELAPAALLTFRVFSFSSPPSHSHLPCSHLPSHLPSSTLCRPPSLFLPLQDTIWHHERILVWTFSLCWLACYSLCTFAPAGQHASLLQLAGEEMSPKRLGKGRVQDKAFRPTTPPLGPKPSEDTILDSIPDDFRYTPLLPEDQHIRVLDVLPRISGRPLECEMRTVPLSDSASSYETVSYCWGDPTPSKVLAVNGAKLRVPTSSWNALNRLAYEDRPRTLWIDAVCINQHDKSERAQQVSLMAKVYSRGQRNVVYLGEHDDEVLVDAAFSTVRTMHSELSQDVVYQRALQRFRNGDLFVPHSQVPIQCDWDHKPLVTLFSSEWFRSVHVAAGLFSG